MIEHCAADILQTEFFSGIGKTLTGRTAGKQIQFIFSDMKFLFQIPCSNLFYIFTEDIPVFAVVSERSRRRFIPFHQTDMFKAGIFQTECKSSCTSE